MTIPKLTTNISAIQNLEDVKQVLHQIITHLNGTVYSAAEHREETVPLIENKILERKFIITDSNGGLVLNPGNKGYLYVPFDCDIHGWSLVADQAGSCELDIYVCDQASFPPGSGDTIIGDPLQRPKLVGSREAENLTLVTWDTALEEGQFLSVELLSVSTITALVFTLLVHQRSK